MIGAGAVEVPVLLEERVKLLSRAGAHEHPVRALARLLDLHLDSRPDAQLSYCHATNLTGLPLTLPPFQVHLSNPHLRNCISAPPVNDGALTGWP